MKKIKVYANSLLCKLSNIQVDRVVLDTMKWLRSTTAYST